jgi:carbamoyltransferase
MITVGIYGIADTTRGRQPTYTHDHSIALMRDGRVLTVVQLERWTGRKHDNRMPAFIGELLARLVPADEEVRFVSVNAFVGSSFISLDGNLRIEPKREVAISSELVPAEVTWYPDGLRRRPAEGWVLCHEFAHLASLLPFIGGFEDGALAAHIDGGASRSACSFWTVRGGRPELELASWDLLKDEVNNFNVNPGVRALLGFAVEEHLDIPGRLMGYAALGQPDDTLEAWLRERRWLLEVDDAAAGRALAERLGTLDPRQRPCQDMAATLQRAFERGICGALQGRAPAGGRLYLAGGAALNVPTNAALQRHFGEVWVPPGTNDSGLALGAAAWVEHLDHGPLPIDGPFLHRFDVPTDEPDDAAIEEAAEMLLAGRIVGVCNGAGELGPRALGHRSLLARADDVKLRVRLSEAVKRREWYRPLAPVLCDEAAREVLDATAAASPLSRWMLGAWPVEPAWRDHLAGVLHLDGSVRAQVVTDDEHNRWLYRLLRLLWRRDGVPALINTSFNGPGEPIVQRHADARACATRLGIDGVVVHGSLHRP